MIITEFAFQKIPRIYFGSDSLTNLSTIIKGKRADNVLLVTGNNSLKRNGKLASIISLIKSSNTEIFHINAAEEPTVEFIDEKIKEFKGRDFDFVISVGGGSVIDTGKALSAMLHLNDSTINYLDGVGPKKHNGQKIPFIAFPTKAGTGSEATNKAVICKRGQSGFKRSLRHNNLIPDYAIIDPVLTLTQSANVTAFSGLDAFTQLIESFLSNKAMPITDALCISGIEYFNDNLIKVCTESPDDINARACLSYGAMISGITLTNAGLGVIHGFASEIGGMFNAPHGAICATLLTYATRVNINVLKRDVEKNRLFLEKYAKIGKILNKDKNITDITSGCNYLIDKLSEWIEILKIPKLSSFGLNGLTISEIIKRVGQKNNPVNLTISELESILKLSI
jgi:alcohol dehydrogenase class IV